MKLGVREGRSWSTCVVWKKKKIRNLVLLRLEKGGFVEETLIAAFQYSSFSSTKSFS